MIANCANAQRRIRNVDTLTRFEQASGDGVDAVVLWVTAVNKDKLVLAKALRVITAASFIDRHLTFNRQNVRHQLANQQQDEAGVNEEDPALRPRQLKASKVGG